MSCCGVTNTPQHSLFFMGLIHWQISYFFDFVPGRICFTFTIMASSVSIQGSQSFKLEATGPKRFYLGKAQQRRTLAGGRFDAQEDEEETEVVPCGWNDDSSSNFVTLRQKWTESSKVPQKSSLRCYWHFQHSICSFIVYFGERMCVCVLLFLQKW